MAFSPDGQIVLTGSHDNTARLWDAATALPVGRPMVHPGEVAAVAFSPDRQGRPDREPGQDGAALGRRDRPAGCSTAGSGPTRAINVRRLQPRRKIILTGSNGHSARLWDAATGRPIGRPLPHPDQIKAVAFSPDGKTILTGSYDRTARLWDADDRPAQGRP